MARYHFNFRDGRHIIINDVDGADFDTFELAYEEAFNAAREMWHDRLMRREDPRKCLFEITDAAGTVVTGVPFAEVLESCHARPRPPTLLAETEAQAKRERERARRLVRDLGEVLTRMRQTVTRARVLRAL